MADADPRIYRRSEVIAFRKTNEAFGGLSNMAPGFPISILDQRIRTSEALYQACRFPHLPHVQRLILDQTSPMTAKMRSKPYRGDSRPDWDAVRVPIMKWCLRVKLAQNWSTFGALLLETGDRPIVEDSRKDDFWGAKVGEDGVLRGRNVLGRLLMELREKLRTQPEALETVVPVPIPDFLLLSREIPTVVGVVSREEAQPERVHDAPWLLDLAVNEQENAEPTKPTPAAATVEPEPARVSDVGTRTPNVTARGRYAHIAWLAAGAVLLAAAFWLSVD